MSQSPSLSRLQKLSGKVLLVEDDIITGPWLAERLKRVGLDSVLKSNLSEAMAALQSDHFHALVTDIFLESQDPDGLKLVKEAEKLGVPALIVSSQADLKIAKEAMNHGASFLIEKPFEPEAVVLALQKIWNEPKGLLGLVDRFLDMHHLTNKEKEIVRLLLKGLSNKEIAEIGDNSDRTIKFHLTTIFEKCGVASRTELFNAIFPT